MNAMDYIMTQRDNSPLTNNAHVIQLALMSQSKTLLTTPIVSFPDWWATTVTSSFLFEAVHSRPVLEKRVPQYHNIKSEASVCGPLVSYLGFCHCTATFSHVKNTYTMKLN